MTLNDYFQFRPTLSLTGNSLFYNAEFVIHIFPPMDFKTISGSIPCFPCILNIDYFFWVSQLLISFFLFVNDTFFLKYQ